MVRHDRFLTGILIAIGLLALTAVILFYVRQGEVSYTNDSQPEDVLHNYILAIQNGDYNQAYTYLAEGDSRPEVSAFRQVMASQQDETSRIAVEIGEANIDGSEAVVEIYFIYPGSDLFSDSYRTSNTASLIQESGDWKVVYVPYPYWSYDWTIPGLR